MFPFHLRRRRGLMLFGLLAAMVTGCDSAPGPAVQSPAAATVSDDATDAKVAVEIRPGDAAPLEATVPWQESDTVFSVLQRAAEALSLEVEFRGSEDTLFVTSIAGAANEGAAGDNWVFRVNGQLGDRGAGVYPVAAQDRVVWSLGAYQPDEGDPGADL